MKRYLHIPVLTVILILVLTGCSSMSKSPIQPVEDESDLANLPLSDSDTQSINHFLSGQYQVSFDTDNLTSQICELKSLASHMRVDMFLPPPVIQVLGFDPVTGIVDVNVTISNPTPYDGHDLRLIIYTDNYGVRLRNADDWTDLWDIPGGAAINPFKAYAKDHPGRLFAGHTSHTERLQVYIPQTPVVTIAIDVSFPGNCDEPYKIDNFTQTTLYDYQTANSVLEVDVYDWQDNVNQVQLYCPTIAGVNFPDFTKVGINKWRLNLNNQMEANEGNYFAAIIASSENASNNLYETISINVEKSNFPEWTWLIYITEDNLGDRIQGDINEMEVVGSAPGILNAIVCWDKYASTNDVILKIGKDPAGYNDTIISTVIDDHDEVIPPSGLPHANPATLEKFFRWGMREYPAKKYGFIPYGHGNGPFRGPINPDDFLVVCGGMQVWELRDLCQNVLNEHPEVEKLEFINIISCLCAWIETAYCLKDVSNVVIASEYLEYANDFEWSEMFAYMVSNIDTVTTNDLGAKFVANYLDNTVSSATLCAWDCSKLDSVVFPALNTFSQELTNALPGYRTTIQSCRTQNENWGAYCAESAVKDLGLFAEHLSQKTLPQSLINAALDMSDAIDSAMIAHGHNYSGSGMCPDYETGWQIWFPANYYDDGNASRRQDYGNIGFDTLLWDDFLGAYQIGDPPVITHAENKIANNTGKEYYYHGFSVNASSIYWTKGTWNFSDDVNASEYSNIYLASSDSEFNIFRTLYPLATTVKKYVNGENTYYYPRYFDDTGNGFKCELGMGSDSGGPLNAIVYDSPSCMPYPLDGDYSAFFTATSAGIPGWQIEYEVDAVGHGRVTTELGTYNCLLLRYFVTEKVNDVTGNQYVSYMWVDSVGKLIAQITSTSFDEITLIPTGTATGLVLYASN
jgi:hypothetical protein